MKFELESHKGVTLVDPEIKLIGTFDNPEKETFRPTIIFMAENINIAYDMPEQPYVKGTWTDEDVKNAIDQHLKIIEIK